MNRVIANRVENRFNIRNIEFFTNLVRRFFAVFCKMQIYLHAEYTKRTLRFRRVLLNSQIGITRRSR